jgi:hypothetical protein
VSDSKAWLPSLVLLEDHKGDWKVYLEAIYLIFKRDFVDSKPSFPDRRVGLKRYPMTEGKEATFWHFITEGNTEEDRHLDLRRCERIAWPRVVIEAIQGNNVCVWPTIRGNEKRVVIALADFSYIVVLADRGDYVLPWTAYCVERKHRRDKLCREYEKAMMAQKG